MRTDIEDPAARGPWVGLALREEYEAPVTCVRAEQRAAGADHIVESRVQWQLTYRNTGNTVCHMKTTLNIDETVMQRLREEAARRGTTMSALVEAGLRRVLAEDGASCAPPDNLPPLPVWRSGGLRVDIANREELYRMLDEG